MAILSGGGNWISVQGTKEHPAPVGNSVSGLFVEFLRDQPSANPALPAQDVLKLDIDGEIKNVGCPRALGKVFRENEVEAGTVIKITYKGRGKTKAGFSFHNFEVETLGTLPAANDASFGFGANEGDAGTSDLERRLADARARRGA